MEPVPVMMKAAFLEKQGGPLITKDTKVPVPGPSEVLVKIAAAPVNPSDLARLRDAHLNYNLAEFIPGLEGSGTVVAAGKGVLPKLWLGKRVACSSAYHTSGTWAEYMVTKAGMCFPLTKKITDEQGSMSLVNPLTAIAFFEIVKKNKHKAIINNPAGSALGRMVELLGNKYSIPVINIVRNRKQEEMLRQSGSKYVIDSSGNSFYNELSALTLQLNATILFDAVCSRELPAIIDLLPRNSSVVIYGNMTVEETISINPRSLIDKNIQVSGFFLGNNAKENGLVKNMLNILKVRRLMESDLQIKIHRSFPLTKVQEAVETYMQNMSSGKIILKP